MGVKSAEGRLTTTLKKCGIGYWHKYKDMRYCPICKNLIPKEQEALPKTKSPEEQESVPDYAVAPFHFWIECKNNDAGGTWNFTELFPYSVNQKGRYKQRNFLINHNGWLYVELGIGRAPNGVGAFLVPFQVWVDEIEPGLIEKGISSIRFEDTGRGTDAHLYVPQEYWLVWDNGGFVIPSDHVFWLEVSERLGNMVKMVQQIVLQGKFPEV